MNRMPEAIISAYVLSDGCRIERTTQHYPESWTVRDGFGKCLGSNGWEYEPLASHRDDMFLQRCRFPSAPDAYDAWVKTRIRIN